MNHKTYRYLAALLFVLSLNVNAEYKTSGEMTKEESLKVIDTRAEYNECLDESALTRLEHQNDIRVVADHSMKDCAPILEDLYEFLLSGNYAPEPTKRLVNSISNRGVNELLSNLMMFMATRSQ